MKRGERNRVKAMTQTDNKIMLKKSELVHILNEAEISQFMHIIEKIKKYDEQFY